MPIAAAPSIRRLRFSYCLRRHPNVYCDISSVPPQSILQYYPWLERVADKAMFGSDWPGPGIHDICLVELADVADGSSVDDAVAAALRLPTNTGRSSTGAIVDYLRDKTMLLVLDNCEHLVKACARLVQTLCREAAGLTVLATSRIPLHLAEEQVVRLEPFATPAINGAERLTVADLLSFKSVQLFTDRAAQSLLHFALTDANVLAVARICQQLDGIPLAIEIAAAQARALPIEAIAERLGQRFA